MNYFDGLVIACNKVSMLTGVYYGLVEDSMC